MKPVLLKGMIALLVGLAGLMGLSQSALAAGEPLKVVATTEDIAALAREVGGGLIQVEPLIRGTQDAHYIEAKPSLMLKVNRADLLIHQGLDLEVGWLPLLISGGRNPAVREGQPGNLDLSRFIVPIEVPAGEVDRSMGDVHPGGNPHYTLDPENGPILARAIAERLGQLVPGQRKAFETNQRLFASRLADKLAGWQGRLGGRKDAVVATYHLTFSYFLKRFGIRSIGTIEPVPGVPPGPAHLGRLADAMKREKVKVILQANYFETETSDLVARQTGAKVLSLPVSVGGAPGAGDYFSLFDLLVDRLAGALDPS